MIKKILTIAIIFFPVVASAAAPNILRLPGLNDFWYINPFNQKRYYISNGDDYNVFLKRVAQPIDDKILESIPLSKNSTSTSTSTPPELAGKMVFSSSSPSHYWYINPTNLKKADLIENPISILKRYATTTDINKLRSYVRGANTQVTNQYSKYERKTVKTRLGDFVTDIIEIDLADPNLKITTDTADNHNCKKNCRARTVQSFIETNNAFAAMNGTYFDTSRSKLNYYFFPIYNSNTKKFINEDQLKWWTTGPLMAFDTNNKFYYFKDCQEFKSKAWFEKKYGVKLQAAIGNKPRLVEEGLNYLIDWEIDKKQGTVKTLRNAIAYKDNKIYLIVTQKSTVPDLAEVLINLGMQYGINIDGGYSTALFYDSKMIVGPGRDVPNAIMFSYKTQPQNFQSTNSTSTDTQAVFSGKNE